jgi:hypothetical protein
VRQRLSGDPPAPFWQGFLLVAPICLGGLAINGDTRMICTSSVNSARRGQLHVAWAVGVTSSATPASTRGGESCGGPCTGDNGD